MVFRHWLAGFLAAAAVLLLAASPASAISRTISWASPPGPGGPFGAQQGVEFSAGGDVCGARRVAINSNLQAVSTASTPDGAKVFFSTTDRLVAADTDAAKRDIYEFSGGQTKLVTVDGDGFNTGVNAYMVGCSQTGSLVFFTSDVLDLWQGSSAGTTTQVNVRETPGNTNNFAPNGIAISADGATVALQTLEPLTTDDTDGAGLDVFKRAGGDTTLVSELTGSEGGGSSLGAISADGSRIYFTSGDQLAANDPSTSQDLYVRSGAADPVVVSVDPDTGDAAGGGSVFQGANPDGSRVYFKTASGIDNADADADGDLYERNAGAGTTTWISKPGPGGTNDAFPQYMASSPDGARVFFTSEGRLKVPDDTDTSTDLYLRTASGLTLVTKQVAGGAQNVSSGCNELAVIRGCASDDATKIFFSTQERLLAADTDTNGDLYRFTAPSGPLQLVTSAASSDEIQLGGASANGQRAVFTTAARLQPCRDADAADSDVYEWDNGATDLISRPASGGQEGAQLTTMSADASTVFFVSNAAYAGSGGDGVALDLFAARPGGNTAGCPVAPLPVVKKPPITPKALTAAAITAALKADLRSALKPVGSLRANQIVKAGGVTLNGLDLPAAGKLVGQVTGAAPAGAASGKRVTVAKGSKRLTKAGTVRFKLKLTKKGKRLLRRAHRRVALTVKLTFVAGSGPRGSASRKVKIKPAKKAKKPKRKG